VILLLTVKTPDEATAVIADRFRELACRLEVVKMAGALGRVLGSDIVACEHVPGFDRSTVDGYAVKASETFGCSESMPAVLTLGGEVMMGEAACAGLIPGRCIAVSTGGDLPESADAVVMVEHTEDYGDGLVGILKPAAPGNNIIFKGDDVSPGDRVLKAGTLITPHDIGILSALGLCEVEVRSKPVVGVISTGDELVEPSKTPGRGQIRDVNTPMLVAVAQRFCALAKDYGIVRDEEGPLREAVERAAGECDIVLISGGSSAGTRDLTSRVIESIGEMLFHGIAMKPGKPTILGAINDKPVFGLPGHPVAAYFVTELFVRPLVAGLMGADVRRRTASARISEAVSSNHGRAEYMAVHLDGDGMANPIRGKSGLIASLAGADGYICIPRDSEGLAAGTEVIVTYF